MIAEVEDVFVVVEPRGPVPFDQEEELKRMIEEKLLKLQNLEAQPSDGEYVFLVRYFGSNTKLVSAKL